MDVLQVTWQKDSEELHDNIATYSKTNGLKIHKPYEERMNFTSLELHKTSITFWDTRMDDSGCYKCLFNTYPSGPFSGDTCLSVFGEALCRDMFLVKQEVFSHPQYFLEQIQELQWQEHPLVERDVETEHYCCEQNSVGHIQDYCGRFGSCLLFYE